MGDDRVANQGQPTAAAFVAALWREQADTELAKYARYFPCADEQADGDRFIGVRMGTVFALARDHAALPLDEIEALLDDDIHEARAGALRIMANRAKAKSTDDPTRRQLYELYLRRHDRINNWDLVDLGAWDVVGGWLRDHPREVLYRLAESESLWERRTAMLATLAFVRRGELDDAYAIAERLLGDPEDLVRKPIGAVLRAAGDRDEERLRAFLDRHGPSMARVTLRFAIEHFDEATRRQILAGTA
ncbi:DNA alkylation repair protein [Kitasatospora indigofera]|uniref:DNA alkylation repair protein n=1 Tax=Kitasatospora indigofera TaxID=67307 RepID=UPI0036B7F5D9